MIGCIFGVDGSITGGAYKRQFTVLFKSTKSIHSMNIILLFQYYFRDFCHLPPMEQRQTEKALLDQTREFCNALEALEWH